MIQAVATLDELLDQRVAAKRVEDDAAEARRELDTQIASLLFDPAKPEGSVTKKCRDYKVTVIFGVTRSVDTETLQRGWAALSEAAQSAFKFKADVVSAGLKALTGTDALAAAAYITSKPKTPSVAIAIA